MIDVCITMWLYDMAKLCILFGRPVTGRKHYSRGRWHWTSVVQIDVYTRGGPTDVTITLACIV